MSQEVVINFLMRLPVPLDESRIGRSSSARLPKQDSMLCAALGFAALLVKELLYRDVLREALGLVQKPKALKIFTAVYHSSHSLNERKVSKSSFIHKTSKLTAYLYSESLTDFSTSSK